MEPFDGEAHLCGNFHLAVLLFELVYMMHFEIGVGEETGTNSLEASVGNREEDTTQMDDVARIQSARETAIHVHGHGPRNMANRDLICLWSHMSNATFTRYLRRNTISWIFTSWNGLKRQARVCMCREPLMLFLTHSLSF